MKILFVINALTIGGAQFVLLDLVKAGLKRGHIIEVACFKKGLVAEMVELENVKVHLLGETFFDIPGFISLVKLIRKFKPDIIHSHLFRASFWTRLARIFSLKSSLITTIHGIETKLYTKLERYMGCLSDKIVFSSNFLHNWYKTHIYDLEKSGICIYPGVSVQEKNMDLKAVSDKPLTIGTLSRLHPVKGIDCLIKACSELNKKGLDFRLIVGGDGSQKSVLIELAKHLGIVDKCEFVGSIKDKSIFIENLDVFVAPSRAEAFGIHICEAMERSLPILAANVGGIPEILIDGVTGRFFEPDNHEELANLLIDCHKNLKVYKIMGYKGRERVEKLFNREGSLDSYFFLYQKLFSEKKKRVHFVISSGEMGGGERLAFGLIKRLKEKKYKVSVTCSGEPLLSSLKDIDVPVSVTSMKYEGIIFALTVAKDLLKLRPSFISSHLNKASLISGYLGKFFGIKCLSHVHGLNRLSYYSHSDRLIAVSKAVKKHICEQGAQEANISVISNCIDKPALTPRTLSSGGLNLAITAKLHANKGHEWALKAILKNIDKLPVKAIHIIGDGPEREKLQKICSENRLENIVLFHGYVKETDNVNLIIDIALLPSAGEGIPLSLLEAMRFGIPSVATDIGGIPEIISHGVNGLLIPYKDEKALIDAIIKIADPSTYAQFSKACIKSFKILNNYDNMVDEFEKLL